MQSNAKVAAAALQIGAARGRPVGARAALASQRALRPPSCERTRKKGQVEGCIQSRLGTTHEATCSGLRSEIGFTAVLHSTSRRTRSKPRRSSSSSTLLSHHFRNNTPHYLNSPPPPLRPSSTTPRATSTPHRKFPSHTLGVPFVSPGSFIRVKFCCLESLQMIKTDLKRANSTLSGSVWLFTRRFRGQK